MRTRTLCVLAIAISSAANAQDRCGELLQNGIHDSWSAVLQTESTQYLHQALCERDRSNRAGNTSFGLEIPIEGVPIGLRFSDAQVSAYARSFCSERTEWNRGTVNAAGFSSIASEAVINGYLNCIELKERGVSYSIQYPQPDVADLDLTISEPPAGRLPLFRGFDVHPPGAAVCNFVAASDDLSPKIGALLTPAFYQVRCVHQAPTQNATAVLALDSAPGIRLSFAGRGDLRSNEAAALSEAIGDVDRQLQALSQSLSKPTFHKLSSGKNNRGSVGPVDIGVHRFCALSMVQDVHGDDGCGCLLAQNDRGEWALKALKEDVTGVTCHCAAACI